MSDIRTNSNSNQVQASKESPEEMSLGELVNRMTTDLSDLFRQEVALAKVEIKEEATKAGKGAGMMGGTAFAAYLAVVLLSFAIVWGISSFMSIGWAFFTVGVIYAIVAAVLFSAGRKEIKSIHGPELTKQTIKEDTQWARKQMS